jgi:hypothetical protein
VHYVTIYESEPSTGMGGLQFFDQNCVKILEAGTTNSGWTTKEFIINENERIFGVVSTSKANSGKTYPGL